MATTGSTEEAISVYEEASTSSRRLGSVNGSVSIQSAVGNFYKISTNLGSRGYGYVEKSYVSVRNSEVVDPSSAQSGTIRAYPHTTLFPSSASNESVGTLDNGTQVDIYNYENGRYQIYANGNYYWTSANNVSVANTQREAEVPSVDVTTLDTRGSYQSAGYTDTNPNWQDVFASLEGDADGNTEVFDDSYYKKLGFKYFNALGYPPKYNMDIDLQYPGATSTDENADDSAEMFLTGRVMSKTYLSNPPILSICPGTVRMFPNLIGTERENFIDAMEAIASGIGDDSLVKKIKSDDGSIFSGKLYQFEADTKNYAYYVNALCRACAILLNIGDEKAPWTGAPLKTFDYSYWAIRNQYNEASAAEADDDKSTFRDFWPGLFKKAAKVYTSLVEDTTYINFFLTGSETQVSETIQTGVSDGPLVNIFNTVNELANSINYFTGSGFTYGSDDETLRNILQTGNTTLDGIVDVGKNIMQGGKIVLPKMVSGAEYGKSISCSTKFVSPFGDPYSVFLRCIVPICHLLALALPKQLSDNMYTYPFLIRANQVGAFHVDLGVISNITINRGGPDDTSWTVDGLATEWDVQFEITPLVDELMITGTNHPVLFCKNENLIDYLGNFCGFDLLANNAITKAEITRAFIVNKFTGIPRSIENVVTDTLFNKLSGLSKVAWGS